MSLYHRLVQKSHLGIIIVLIFGNILFFGYFYTLNSEKSYIYSPSGESEYYVLQNNLVSNDQELSKIVESQQLGSLSEQEVISKLSERLKDSEQSKKIAEKIKQQVSDEYKERYIEELKAQVDKDYTQQIFRQLEKSYTLFQELKAKFLIDHSKEIKQSLINDILKDANDDDDGKASNLNSLISSKVDSQINKQNYLSFIFNDLIFAFKPKTESIPKMQEGDSIGGNMFREVLNPGYTKEFLTKERVELKDDVFKDLQDNHDNLVKALHNLDPPLPQFYSGDGIVINGGGVFMTGAIITLIQLRELGSKLPVEIILNDSEDYDDHICKTLLPKYNAGCKIIQQELGDELYRKLKLSSFQFKVVGLLVSSFDNIIALDADNLPIRNPDYLLFSEPFLSSKFLLWPDIWHKGTSPLYYDIARFKISGPPTKRQGLKNDQDYGEYVKKNIDNEVFFHDLQGTPPGIGAETGQLVFSKKEHFRSFVLSLYYNIYGKSHYYRLLFQGTFGSGDRGTFIPALHVMNEPYHLNNYHVWFAGYEEKYMKSGKVNSRLEESTMVQHDPKTSIKFYEDWEKWLKEKNMDIRLYPFQDNDYTRDLFQSFLDDMKNSNNGQDYKLPEVLFLHVHKPKINPVRNLSPKYKFQFKEKVYTQRFLGESGKYNKEFDSNEDWELKFNSIAKWVVCDALDSKRFWNDIANLNQKDVCKKISLFVEFLKRDSTNKDSAKLTSV